MLQKPCVSFYKKNKHENWESDSGCRNEKLRQKGEFILKFCLQLLWATHRFAYSTMHFSLNFNSPPATRLLSEPCNKKTCLGCMVHELTLTMPNELQEHLINLQIRSKCITCSTVEDGDCINDTAK